MRPNESTPDTVVLRTFRNRLASRAGGHLTRQSVRENRAGEPLLGEDGDGMPLRLRSAGMPGLIDTGDGRHGECTAAGAHRVADLPQGPRGALHRRVAARRRASPERRHASAGDAPHDRRKDGRRH